MSNNIFRSPQLWLMNVAIIIFYLKAFFYCPVVNVINILQAAFATLFLHQKIKSQAVRREKLRKTLKYKKVSSKMLMILSPNRSKLTIYSSWPLGQFRFHY